jgi:hypothetical protein
VVKHRLQYVFAVAILIVWLVVVLRAVIDKDLIPLATVITPVMLLPAGWLFTDGYLKARRANREDDDGEEADSKS